ncbi:TPA: hypothetical protein ACH3X1_015269 [Trebouxia sp. C0004]
MEEMQRQRSYSIDVCADMVWIVDQNDTGFLDLWNQAVTEGIAKDSCSSSLTDIVQHLLFPAKALEPVVIERSSGHCFTDVDSTWKARDCGLFGDNRARTGLLPMLKVYDKEAYVRLDAQYTFNFKRQDTSAAH